MDIAINLNDQVKALNISILVQKVTLCKVLVVDYQINEIIL